MTDLTGLVWVFRSMGENAAAFLKTDCVVGDKRAECVNCEFTLPSPVSTSIFSVPMPIFDNV